MNQTEIIFGALGVVLAGVVFLILAIFRKVVSTNEVHIIQTRKKTTSFGKDSGNGNIYYEWPSWVPFFGISKIVLPVSVFDLDLAGYEAYDKGRLPFVVDVKAFFRITDSNLAAQRVANFQELESQLRAIVQGAVRTILASNEIEEIMQGRSKFGEEFTKEVSEQLSHWGVGTVKNIELMDIRDHDQSKVIQNIMAKKKSHIEMESRQEVAKNMKNAEIAEVEANREVEVQKQIATQAIGLKTIEAKRQVAVAEQEAMQLVKEQEKTTQEKQMNVLKVQRVREAEISKEVRVVQAEQDKASAIIESDGVLEATKRSAEGIRLEGAAKADAETAILMAPVKAQAELAKEIGANDSYQKYLVTIKQIEATQAIGVEQAKALEKADIKVIANTGETAGSGLTKVMDLFSSNGGTKIGALLEGLAQSEKGDAALTKLGIVGKKAKE
jgi:flotillin